MAVKLEDMDFMKRVTRLRRAKNGDTYHLTGCPRARNTVPWLWAEGKTKEEVESSHANGLRPCKICDPLKDWE